MAKIQEIKRAYFPIIENAKGSEVSLLEDGGYYYTDSYGDEKYTSSLPLLENKNIYLVVNFSFEANARTLYGHTDVILPDGEIFKTYDRQNLIPVKDEKQIYRHYCMITDNITNDIIKSYFDYPVIKGNAEYSNMQDAKIVMTFNGEGFGAGDDKTQEIGIILHKREEENNYYFGESDEDSGEYIYAAIPDGEEINVTFEKIA